MWENSKFVLGLLLQPHFIIHFSSKLDRINAHTSFMFGSHGLKSSH